MMQQSLQSSVPAQKRAKSVYATRNLGTIKDRKKEKREKQQQDKDEPGDDGGSAEAKARRVGAGGMLRRLLQRRSDTCHGEPPWRSNPSWRAPRQHRSRW